MDDELARLGRKVRALRSQLGLSQEKFAERAHLHRTYISSLEAGRRNVSFLNLLQIARALNVAPSELLDGFA